MKKLFKTLPFLVLIGALSVSCKRNPEQKAKWIMSRVSSELNLNENQRSQLEDIKNEIMAAKKRHKEDKQRGLEEAKSLILSQEIGLNQVQELMARRQDLIQEELPNIFPKIQSFHAGLSAEQKQKIVNFMNKFHQKRFGHH